MEYKDEIINLRIEPSYKESLLVNAKQEKMTLAKYCREKLTKDLDLLVSQSNRCKEILKKLYLIQGDRTAALTYQLHIRALRCNFQLDQALDMAKNGLCRFPENLEIVEDCAVLAEQLQDWKTAVVAIGILIDIKGPQNTEDLQIRLKISQDMLDKQNTEKKQKNSGSSQGATPAADI